MYFHPISKNKIIAELSKDDMKELDITYDQMDYSNIETRRVIWTVLEKIREFSGRDIDPSCNLLIEAVASQDGGCVLCFTIPDNKRTLCSPMPPVLTKNTSGIVFEFENINTVLDMLKSIGKENLSPDSRIFKKDNRYRILFGCAPAPEHQRKIEEFGTFVGQNPVICAHTAEHWQQAGKI
ncbi:MAG: hypothetical protein IJU45_02780 [Clostridia bacterium]|nr:hypothetical protein [Clostridia bacterium]